MKKVLKFLNLIDQQGRLSITNVAVIILLAKIAIAPSIDWAVISGLLVTMINYSHKRYESNKVIPANVDSDVLKQTIEEVRKVAEEAKDKASKAAIAVGFKPKSNHGL